MMMGSLSLSLCACAESPDRLIDPVLPQRGFQGATGQQVQAHAVNFKGSDLFGNDCSVDVTFHNNAWILRFNYVLHGEVLADAYLSEYQYNQGARTFRRFAAGTLTDRPVLTVAVMSDPNATADLDQINNYLSGALKHHYRMDFKNGTQFADFESFEDAIKAVEQDQSQYNTYLSELDALSQLYFIVKHGGHYDPGTCSGLAPNGVNEITFDRLEGDHDDDDHDHDHDHDGDHDHN